MSLDSPENKTELSFDKEIIGKNLRTLRTSKKMTQEQVAEQFHVVKDTVSKWETGKRRPDLETLYKLAKFYNVNFEDIATDNIDTICCSITPQTENALNDKIKYPSYELNNFTDCNQSDYHRNNTKVDESHPTISLEKTRPSKNFFTRNTFVKVLLAALILSILLITIFLIASILELKEASKVRFDNIITTTIEELPLNEGETVYDETNP